VNSHRPPSDVEAMTPQAHILLATFNGEHFLAEQLDSIVVQDDPDFVLLVRDDGSTDRTVEILTTYAAADSRIVVLDDSAHLGAPASFATLMLAAPSGAPLYLFADQDDFWMPDRLSRARVGLARTTSPTLYGSRVEYSDSKLRRGPRSRRVRRAGLGNALVENVFTGCASAVNSAARDLLVDLSRPADASFDWWVYLVVATFGDLVTDDNVTVRHRFHGANATIPPLPFIRSVLMRLRRHSRRRTPSTPFRTAAMHLRTLGGIPDRHSTLLDWYLGPHEGLRGRVRLVCSRRVWKNSRRENMILRLRLALLGV
jgi:glycosyltransferase involved in cell wall biosynthesis